MIKRALDNGFRAKYVLMDSWFSMPSAIAALREPIHVVCMLKDHPKWLYKYLGRKLRLSDLYKKLKKKRVRAKVKAQAIVRLSNGKQAKVVFVPCDKKRGWLALLSTDLSLPNEEIIQLYGKRWDIVVSSKGHINQSVKVRPRIKDSSLVAGEAPWRETKMVKPSDNILKMKNEQTSRPQRAVNADVASLHEIRWLRRSITYESNKAVLKKSLIQAYSPGGYQRWHGRKVELLTL
jgi:hypothetical protein